MALQTIHTIPRQHEWVIYDLRQCMLPPREERYKLSYSQTYE
jgi:hypothetical protein